MQSSPVFVYLAITRDGGGGGSLQCSMHVFKNGVVYTTGFFLEIFDGGASKFSAPRVQWGRSRMGEGDLQKKSN